MKAYQITNNYLGFTRTFVVFAETANKARSIGRFLFHYYGYEYIYTKARRLPLLDRFYDGQEEINYYNPEVKQILDEEYSWVFEGVDNEQKV